MIKRILLALLLVVGVLVVAVAGKTWLTPSRQIAVAPVVKPTIDAEAAAKRLSSAIVLQTVSSADDPTLNAAEFDKLHLLLARQYPKLHATLKKEVIGQHALLYTWAGTDAKAPPIALMAHQDVVPIASGTEKSWTQDPFSGLVQDGYIWGRGTMDNKGNLLSQMEAIEMLIGGGFQPKQTVYLIAGDDEEVNGLRGAKPIAELLAARGVRLSWVLDEGLAVIDGVIGGLDQPAALVGLAEKGYGTFFLSLDAAPGHSSMPPPHSAIGTMSAALARLENDQMPASIGGVAGEMFATLAPEMKGINRVMLSNLWLTTPLVKNQLEKNPSTNATLRTTTALTILQAGNKDNVLPGHVDAAVNFRLLPGDSLASVEAHMRKALGNDTIQVKSYAGNAEPSPISPTDNAGYRAIQQTLRQEFPDTVVAPGLMTAATDSRHMRIVSDAIYRFSPLRLGPRDLGRFHGTDERISVANYAEMIQFYRQLLINASGPAGASPAL